MDRIFRSTIDALQTTKAFDKWGVSFHSIEETLHTRSAKGRFFFTLTSALAEMERRLIGERTKAALAHKRSKSEKTAGDIPYSYDLTPQGLLVKNETEQRSSATINSRLTTRCSPPSSTSLDGNPVDEQALFRISLQRLIHRLSDNENRCIRHQAMEGMSDVSIKKRMGITFPHLSEMKRNIRTQIDLAFAA